MHVVKEIEDKKIWEAFLQKERSIPTPFFQSWNWGEVQKRLGNTIFRLGLFKNKRLVGVCLVVVIRARRGIYLHLRHGPVLDNISDLKVFIEHIKSLGNQQKAGFVRLSPLIPLESKSKTIFKSLNTRNAPVHNMDAENTWVLDLSADESSILSSMRKTTRYLVRKAEKIGVTVKRASTDNEFKNFFKMYDATSKRHHFIPHKGVSEELNVFSKDNQAELLLAFYKKKLISGAIIIYYGNQAIYHHGASADEFKEIPGAYLIQWEAIKEAKKREKKFYNFWGVVPPEKPKHPWQGITLFKTGFGGSGKNFVHSQDIPLNLAYWKTFSIETVWRIRKGY